MARLNEQFPKCGRKPEAVVERPLQELEAQCAPKLEEPEPVHFVETDPMRARRLQAEHDAAWNAWLDARLDERFADERDSMVEIASIAPERARRVIGSASFVTRRGSGEPFVANGQLHCWRCSDVLKWRSSWAPTTAHTTSNEIAMRCISNGKIMQRAKDDEAQKRVEQGGWYVVTKNDYKRWLARQQQQPVGAPDEGGGDERRG